MQGEFPRDPQPRRNQEAIADGKRLILFGKCPERRTRRGTMGREGRGDGRGGEGRKRGREREMGEAEGVEGGRRG
jgi:hypothetical protein